MTARSALAGELLEEIRRRLAQARRDIYATVTTTDEDLATLEAHQPGSPPEDAATETASEILSRLEGREKHELDEIDAAQGQEGHSKEAPMTAHEIMTPDPVTVTPKTTLAEAWDLMRELDIRHLPVVDGEALIGMLSDRDLGSIEIPRLLTEEGADALRQRLVRPVLHMMSVDVVAAEAETEMSELISLFLEQKVGAVPVVTPDTRRIVGIVSYIDVLRVLQDALESE